MLKLHSNQVTRKVDNLASNLLKLHYKQMNNMIDCMWAFLHWVFQKPTVEGNVWPSDFCSRFLLQSLYRKYKQ